MRIYKILPAKERFFSKVRKTETCWIWTGSMTRGNYGNFCLYVTAKPARPMRAHRASWIIHNGPIPDGLWVLHKCDNPPCIRPDHLFLGTSADNTKDKIQKGRAGYQIKTHCVNGHPYTPENIKQTKASRRCLICLEKYSYKKLGRRVVTHCPTGHEYTEENTRRYRGRRHCRACQKLRDLKIHPISNFGPMPRYELKEVAGETK